MAVTASFSRNHSNFTSSTIRAFITATLSGSYATGGFTWNPFTVPAAGKGSSPLPTYGLSVLDVTWKSPLGYIYVTTISGVTATTKIYSAANTEFGNGVAVPDASVPMIVEYQKGV